MSIICLFVPDRGVFFLCWEADALVAQGRDPRAGFTGEINYFRQTPEEAGIPVPPVEEPEVEPSPKD